MKMAGDLEREREGRERERGGEKGGERD